MDVQNELINFVLVWTSATISLCYCYAIGKIIPKGFKRFIFVLPIVCVFLYLPLKITSVHLGGTTAFFIVWLANFKLLLFAFGLGPLCSDPSISLPLFVAVSCLPIKIQQNLPPRSQNFINSHHQQVNTSPESQQICGENGERTRFSEKPRREWASYAIKGLLLAILVRVYDYTDDLHPNITLFLYCFHIYFLLELILAINATMARAVLGLELEPQFNEPYLATSLQDFWGRRWNLMVTSILRPTVYKPALHGFSRALGRKWASPPAVFFTFVVSGLMHELMFFYLGRMDPTWEVTWFFVLQGTCVIVEMGLKKALAGKFWLPSLVSRILTLGFVVVSGFWLFFPHLTRCRVDTRAIGEYAAVGASVKNIYEGLVRIWHVSKL